jgi:DNA-binding response OmpR family regulator
MNEQAGSLRILIIDDDEAIRDSMQMILSAHGYQTCVAGGGPEGLGRLTQEQFDIVITDILMPDVDGIETIREIRKHHPSMKILAMSGGDYSGRFNSLISAHGLGADQIMRKPIDEDVLLTTIRGLAGT